MLQSDAFRCLTRSAVDVLLFTLSRRQYPSNGRDYWHPLNENGIRIGYETIREFFGTGKRKSPNKATINKAIKELMAAGFIDLVHQGGKGKGDTSTYRLADEWMEWREGDDPVFTREPKRQGFTRSWVVPGV